MKAKNKGISLAETLISITIFSIIIVVMFQMSSDFFKLCQKSSSRQDMNKTFIKSYTQLQKDIIATSGKYVYSYNNKFNGDYKNITNRWFVFPVAIDQNGKFQGEGSSFNWKRIYTYFLTCTNSSCSECPKGFLKPEDEFKYCSDKQLIRAIYEYNGSNDRNYFSSSLFIFCQSINSCITKQEDILYEDGKDKPIFKYIEKKILAKDILDMKISTNNKNIKIIMSSVRKNEAKKEVPYGTTDFTTEPNTKFVDKIEFVINARNS